MRTQRTFLGTSRVISFSIMLGLALTPLSAHAQLDEYKITADDPTGDDHYGRTVAMSATETSR